MATTTKTQAKKAVLSIKTSVKEAVAEKAAPSRKRAPADAVKDLASGSAAPAESGSPPTTRAEATKKVWEYIKQNNLQDKLKR